MKISYNWLKAYVPDIPEPKHLADLFTYHVCEVESVEKLPDGDHIFDLGILPNRAHDLLSHAGVAREISGLLGITFKDSTPMYKTPASTETKLKVEIDSPGCRRYSARIVRNVKVGPSPEWMVKHLEGIGQRSINNIVDATNIVMYDCGQPCHAFDLAKLAGEKIIITNAKDGEELKVVGREGIVAKLNNTDLVINDGEKTLALAGVKGGADSGINNQTTDIVLEVANFDPISVRKTARRLGLLSDSAKRFENDLSPTLCDFGMFALSALLVELLPDASFEDIVDIYKEQQKETKIEFSRLYVNNLLGTEITESDIKDILTRYQFKFTASGNKFSGPRVGSPDAENLSTDEVRFTITIPPLRLDLLNKEDMVEEIGRVYGYDKVKPKLPQIGFTPKINEQYFKIKQARDMLVNAGYKEVMTYTFTDAGDVEVLASASDKKFLRTNLSDGLKKSYELNKLNAPLLGTNEIKIFEIGTIFTKPARSSGGDGEKTHVGWNEKPARPDGRSGGEKIYEFDLEEFIKAPPKVLSERSSDLLAEDSDGRGQTISKSTFGSENRTQVFKIWSQYPFIVRDIAVWVPEETKPEILSEIYNEFGTELMQGEPKLIDSFKKDGRVSYAFRLIFQSYDRTLTDEEINAIISKITEKISSLGFEVR